jgi:hypothetical protein
MPNLAIFRCARIATGFILLRKTPLAVQFLERWLAACEDRRIMSEEASVLGYPEHPGGTSLRGTALLDMVEAKETTDVGGNRGCGLKICTKKIWGCKGFVRQH